MFTKAIAAILALPLVAQCQYFIFLMFLYGLFITRFFLFYCFVVVSADTCTRTYTAQAGDICDSISAANSVSTYAKPSSSPCWKFSANFFFLQVPACCRQRRNHRRSVRQPCRWPELLPWMARSGLHDHLCSPAIRRLLHCLFQRGHQHHYPVRKQPADQRGLQQYLHWRGSSVFPSFISVSKAVSLGIVHSEHCPSPSCP